jgi:archaellum biogenesis ATPase FlaH
LLPLYAGLERGLIWQAVSQTPEQPPSRKPPASLANMQVDVTTRMGALTQATPTGLPILDRLLSGGLRTGTLLSIAGAPGVGKTAFALWLAYMAARSRAAVLFVSTTLDETELMARLAARALHREYPDSKTTYGALWTGQAWQDDATRGPVSAAVDTVCKKVGNHFHVHRADPFESTASLARHASELWRRHDRVVLVVDGIEAFSASASSVANGSFAGRIAEVAFELRRVADEGCAVVTTVQSRSADLISPASTLASEIRTLDTASTVPVSDRYLALGARPVELVVRKNHVGPTGIVPLRFIAGAATFEERAP